MNETGSSEFYEAAENVKNCLNCMSELVDRLETLREDNNMEKTQCIEAMRDNIEIMVAQIEDAHRRHGENSINISNYNKKWSIDTITMKDTRVLIVDDNEINNYVVEQMLKKFKVQVDIALSGETAIEMFKQNEYDLILMDYLLPPGIDGVETVRRIRELGERGEKQLIIGLTANTIEEFKEGLNKYNVELILFKPVKYQQMAVIFQKELPDKIQ